MGHVRPAMAQATSFEAGMITRSDALVGTLARAADYAAGQGHAAITLEHLLLALTEDGDAAGVLVASSVDLARLRNEVAAFIGQQPPAGTMRITPMPDAELSKILTYAEAAARQSGRSEINGAIVLAAILGEGRSMAATFLKAQGLTFQAAIKIIQQVLAPTPPPAPEPEPEPAAPSPAEAVEPTTEAPPPELEREQADPYVPAAPAETFARAPSPDVPRRPREVVGIPSIRQEPPPRPPTPRPQPSSRSAEPPEAQPAPPAPPTAKEAKAELAPVPPPPAPPSPAPAASRPSPQPRPDPTPPRAPAPPPRAPAPAPAPTPSAIEALRPPAPSVSDAPPAQRSPAPAVGRPPPLPQSPAGGPPPPPQHTLRTPPEPVPAPVPGPAHAGLGAPRPAPPRPGLRLPPNPIEGHQITAPWPEPTNDYRAPQIPPSYPPPRPPAGRPSQYQPDPRDARDGIPPRGSRSPSLAPPPGRPQAVEKGQLVENIPRRMKVGVAETFEIRIARDGIIDFGQGMPGRVEPQYHAIRITRAMSVRLKGDPGRFYIEAASPETQWTGSQQTDQMVSDHAVWRFTVIPQLRGPAELTLIVAARSIGSDGVVADSNLPEQRITVRVSANLGRGLKRWIGWAAVAVCGAILGKVGESAWEPTVALVRRLLDI